MAGAWGRGGLTLLTVHCTSSSYTLPQGRKGGGQWCRSKSFDQFCPLGPGIVPANKVGAGAEGEVVFVWSLTNGRASQVDPHDLRIVTKVNGKVVQVQILGVAPTLLSLTHTHTQDANTSDMIWGVGEIISFLSEGTTLMHGTVILTGTPAVSTCVEQPSCTHCCSSPSSQHHNYQGVGFSRNPARYLTHGDVTEVAIEGLGVLRNTFADKHAPVEKGGSG